MYPIREGGHALNPWNVKCLFGLNVNVKFDFKLNVNVKLHLAWNVKDKKGLNVNVKKGFRRGVNFFFSKKRLENHALLRGLRVPKQ